MPNTDDDMTARDRIVIAMALRENAAEIEDGGGE